MIGRLLGSDIDHDTLDLCESCHDAIGEVCEDCHMAYCCDPACEREHRCFE